MESKTIEMDTGNRPVQDIKEEDVVQTTINEKEEESKDVKHAPAISGERLKRVIIAERLSVSNQILNALVGIPNDFFKNNEKLLVELVKKIEDIDSSSANKRTVSFKLKTAREFFNNLVKFMYNMQGLTIATQRDVEDANYVLDSTDKEEYDNSMED